MNYHKKQANFQEVVFYGSKSGICTYCGKHVVRERKFKQFLHPSNKTKDGYSKDRIDVYRDLQQEAENWKCLPVSHKKCEQMSDNK